MEEKSKLLYHISNINYDLSVDTYACEMHSFKRKDKNIEYLWQGLPEYWKGRNPILFPHVSSTSSSILNMRGKDVKVGNHGFLRRSEFELEEQTKDSLKFVLTYNENTLSEYPFKFKIYVTYKLNDEWLNINYEILNLDDIEIPFGFGLHPAFNWPLAKDKRKEDYTISFNKEEVNVENKQLKLDETFFSKIDTFIINNVNSNEVIYSDGDNGVKLQFNDFKLFGIWQAKDSNFICLEPWMNLLDKQDCETIFEKRKGIMFIKQNDSFKCGYSIKLI